MRVAAADKEPRMVSPDEVLHLRPRPQKKKSPLNRVASAIQKKGEVYSTNGHLTPKTKKASKKIRNDDASTPPDSVISNSEYGALRHKYLMLEEESLALDREVLQAEGETKNLEGKKFALLDRLVVLEGLIEPSEQKTLGPVVRKKFL